LQVVYLVLTGKGAGQAKNTPERADFHSVATHAKKIIGICNLLPASTSIQVISRGFPDDVLPKKGNNSLLRVLHEPLPKIPHRFTPLICLSSGPTGR
jgi:hypothetical protein